MNEGGTQIVVAPVVRVAVVRAVIMVMMVVVIVIMVVMIVIMVVMVMIVIIIVIMMMIMAVPVMMVMIVAQQECAHHVDHQPEKGDRNGFLKGNRNRAENARDRLIADQDRDHRQHDGTGEGGKVAELARPECKARIIGVFSGVAVGERGEQ